MLVSPQTHVFEAANALGPDGRKLLFQKLSFFTVGSFTDVGSDKINRKRYTTFSDLLIEDGKNLGADITQSKLSLFQAYLLTDLVFGEAQKILEEMEQQVTLTLGQSFSSKKNGIWESKTVHRPKGIRGEMRQP